MMQNKTKLEIRKARIFSNAFKKQQIKELIQKHISIAKLCYANYMVLPGHRYTSSYTNIHLIINKRLN